MFEKILMAIDESEHAGPVLRMAAEIGAKFESEIRVVHVLETGFVGKAGAVNLESSDLAHKIVDDAVTGLGGRGLKASGIVRSGLHGRLAVEIEAQAQEFGAGMIIMGTRGLTDLEGMLLGSTSHRLMHLSERPVLVVP